MHGFLHARRGKPQNQDEAHGRQEEGAVRLPLDPAKIGGFLENLFQGAEAAEQFREGGRRQRQGGKSDDGNSAGGPQTRGDQQQHHQAPRKSPLLQAQYRAGHGNQEKGQQINAIFPVKIRALIFADLPEQLRIRQISHQVLVEMPPVRVAKRGQQRH
ncbi:MAG: hypothetical protein K6T75_05945, partial [Acetobacteraceae bacterium]|nr:hypothetical protein [Acetobacteraceae bacterium]